MISRLTATVTKKESIYHKNYNSNSNKRWDLQNSNNNRKNRKFVSNRNTRKKETKQRIFKTTTIKNNYLPKITMTSKTTTIRSTTKVL